MALSHRVRVVVSLPHELATWLTVQAESERRDKSKLIQILVERYKESLENDQNNVTNT